MQVLPGLESAVSVLLVLRCNQSYLFTKKVFNFGDVKISVWRRYLGYRTVDSYMALPFIFLGCTPILR